MGVNDLRGSKSGSLKWGFKTAQNRAKRKNNCENRAQGAIFNGGGHSNPSNLLENELQGEIFAIFTSEWIENFRIVFDTERSTEGSRLESVVGV